MVSDSKKGFSAIKDWVKTNQITFINVSATVLLIGIVIIVLLGEASRTLKKTTEDSILHLAGQTANEVQSFYLSYFELARSTSQVLEGYQNIERDERRDFINDTIRGILNSNNLLISAYSLWKPDELDGRDALYANTDVSDETGQYISGFTRARGWVEQRIFSEYKYILDIDYSDSDVLGIINEPRPLTGRFMDSWVVDVQVPVRKENRVVGVVGVTINLDRLQSQIELVTPLETGSIMICTNRGTIVAHNEPKLRGISFMDRDSRNMLPYTNEITSLLFQTMRNTIETRIAETMNTKNDLVVCYPIRTAGEVLLNLTDTGFSEVDYLGIKSSSSRWVVVTSVPMAIIMKPINDLIKFSFMFIVAAAITMIFVVIASSRSMAQQTRNLQHRLEHSTTLRDNLKFGLFLMDSKYDIQAGHSKAMEKIMSVSDLNGKNFMALISSSVKPNEQQGVMDYFEMIYRDAFDKDMLESINPINEFTYFSTETSEKKNLRTSFALTGQGKLAYIMGTIEDITEEKELEKQLLEAENIRENEMRSLFQVIQLDPRVLSDFVDDAEYEFDTINSALKSKKQLHAQVLVDLYQSIHAIKSNALILNLDGFAERLHKLESSVKNLQEKHKDIVPFDEFLGLVLELNEAMKEIDQLKATVLKIENFKNTSRNDENQERYVLVETLSRVCDKTQAAMNKKVRFVVDRIDNAALDNGPRRAIKEILTQLVRNAVYHGIETPEERGPLGKEPEGEIKLSMRYMDNQIVIKLTDNGKGIDFGRIRQMAQANNLLRSPAEANDKNFLLKTIFSAGLSTAGEADLHAGRGVGLSLVKDRIKELHGSISVSTISGRGTTFTINIPTDLHIIDKVS
jgi:two-component system chemotaxis sensor kinase CheA